MVQRQENRFDFNLKCKTDYTTATLAKNLPFWTFEACYFKPSLCAF